MNYNLGLLSELKTFNIKLMEDKQYKELTDFIGGQFTRVWNEFDRTHTEIKEVKTDVQDLKKDFVQLQSAVDAYAHKADVYFQELLALSTKVDRLEKWINQIADKVGIKLG